MPVYDFHCEECGQVFELRRGMTEEQPVHCQACGSSTCRRIFGSVSIVKSGADRAKDVSWIDRDLARRLRKKSGGVLSPEFKRTLDRMEAD